MREGRPGPARTEPVDAEELLHAALDGLDAAIVVVDADLRVLFANEALVAVLGAPPVSFTEAVVSASGVGVLREDGSAWPSPDRPVQRAVRTGQTTVRELMGLVYRGGSRWVQVSARPLLRPGERAPWGAVGTYHDVTERRRAGLALAESEAHFRLLAENSTDAIQRHDASGTCLYTSPAMVEVLGWRPEQIAGTPATSRVHPDDLEEFLDHYRVLLRTREPQLLRFRALRSDGSWAWVESVTRPVVGADGRVDEVQSSLRDISARVQAEERLARLALVDTLTGLANRAALEQHLDDRLAAGERFALLFLDLDRFKVVNDSLGHSAGDELLRTVAGRLSGTCRDGDVVARLGGDEFVVVARDLDEAGALLLAERVQRVLAAPVQVAGHDLVVSASIGIVTGGPGVESAEDLLRWADTSMYRAKARGRQAVVLGGHGRAPGVARLSLERDLRASLRHEPGAGEVEAHFQPQVELRTGRVLGVEALARWRHPERGLLEPDQFLAVADDAGLVADLGRQVLEQAVVQAAAWRALPGCADLSLSVNLSAQELLEDGRAADTVRLLEQHGLPREALTVEVLESVLLDPEGAVAAGLAEYTGRGVRLALDDFGTGSSSLLHLRDVPVGVVKVDRAFVAGLGRHRPDEAIVRAVRSLTDDLGLVCVAEGVETDGQRRWLLEQGVRIGQGFLLHRPLPAAAVTRLLSRDG